jgi:hypothetical protein
VGRPRKVVEVSEDAPVQKKRGRKPKVKVLDPVKVPKKRGRKPRVSSPSAQSISMSAITSLIVDIEESITEINQWLLELSRNLEEGIKGAGILDSSLRAQHSSACKIQLSAWIAKNDLESLRTILTSGNDSLP